MVSNRHAGFTLIELVVVLAIIAAISAIAYTWLMPLATRVRIAFDRDDFERQLLELPQRVRLDGRGGVLTGLSGDRLPGGMTIEVEGAAKAGNALEEWQVLRLDVPNGWRLVVSQPVFYHFSGACEGGVVAFVLPTASLRYVLTAPLCRPIRADEAAAG
jgi:prepilin-type N-terminal cleavage/methylation domain-containing protein